MSGNIRHGPVHCGYDLRKINSDGPIVRFRNGKRPASSGNVTRNLRELRRRPFRCSNVQVHDLPSPHVRQPLVDVGGQLVDHDWNSAGENIVQTRERYSAEGFGVASTASPNARRASSGARTANTSWKPRRAHTSSMFAMSPASHQARSRAA